MRRSRKIALAATLLAVCAASAARAATYFVDGACGASGSGASLTCGASGPFRTIGEGVLAMRPGDTLNIRGPHDGFDGAYFEQIELTDGAVPGRALACTATQRCVIQGCSAPTCPTNERPLVRGMTRRSDWQSQSSAVFSRVMEAAPEVDGQERDAYDPHMLLQGSSTPLTMLAYAGDAVSSPADGEWSYHPSSRRVFVNPVGSAAPAAEIWVPHFHYNVHMENPTAYVTLQDLTFEGTRGRSIEAHGSASSPAAGLVFRRLVQRYVARHFVLVNPAHGLLIEDSLAEYGCRGISWALSTGDGCFGYRVFGAHGAVLRRNVLRHLGASGRRRLSGGSTGWACPWCDAPWNDATHTDVSTTGTAINVKQTDGATVEDNAIDDVVLEGVALDVSRRVVVQRNVVTRARDGIGMRDFTPTDGCPTTNAAQFCYNQDHVIRANVIDRAGGVSGERICAIGIEGHDQRHTGGTFLAQIYNNVISRPSAGAICARRGDAAAVVSDLAIWNNTVWGANPIAGTEQNTHGIVLVDPTRNVQMRNNLLSELPGDGLVLGATTLAGLTLDGDLIDAAGGCAVRWGVPSSTLVGGTCSSLAAFRTSNPTQETHGRTGDPRFLAPDAASPDLHLTAGSAAIDVGVALASGIVDDVDGDARPLGLGWDVGADESETCGDGLVHAPEQCDDGNLVDGDGCDSNCTRTGCGNGIRTGAEQCDDGNLGTGDCCDGSCRLEATGSPCDDGLACTNPDTCAAGQCVGDTEPAAGCRRAGGGSVLLRDGGAAQGDALKWRWRQGGVTMMGDFGDPLSATAYTLCVYDRTGGSGQVLFEETIAPGGLCDGAPCWRPVDDDGFSFKRVEGTSRTDLQLRTNGLGEATLKLKRKGPLLSSSRFPLNQEPQVVVQLVNDAGVCWETTHTTPAKRSTTSQFVDPQD